MSNLVGQNYQKATPIFTANGGDKMAKLEVQKAEILGDGNTGPVELPFLLIHFAGVDDDGNEIPPAGVGMDVGKWLIYRKPGGWVWIGEQYTDIFPDDAPPILYNGMEFRGLTRHKAVVACARVFLDWMWRIDEFPVVVYEKDGGFRAPFESYNAQL